jgi:hypothetical protein
MRRSAVLCAALALFPCWFLLRPASGGTAVRMEIEDLVREADLVFEGRVLAASARRDERGLVRTRYTVSVERTWWGTPRGTRVFELPGGLLPDGSGTLIPGLPRLVEGEDALLFLSSESANHVRMPVGLAQGKFRIARDASGRRVLVRTQEHLVLVDPSTGASVPAPSAPAFDYEGVVERVRAAAARRREGR